MFTRGSIVMKTSGKDPSNYIGMQNKYAVWITTRLIRYDFSKKNIGEWVPCLKKTQGKAVSCMPALSCCRVFNKLLTWPTRPDWNRWSSDTVTRDPVTSDHCDPFPTLHRPTAASLSLTQLHVIRAVCVRVRDAAWLPPDSPNTCWVSIILDVIVGLLLQAILWLQQLTLSTEKTKTSLTTDLRQN